MLRHMKYYQITLLMVFMTSLTYAQERVTEAQIQRQQIFIEANREKLLGNYDKAVESYLKVLKDDPRNHAAAYELARIHDLRSDWDEALRYLKIAIDNDASNEWYKKLMADVLEKAGRNAEAAKIYEGLVSRFPNNEYYYFKQAFFLVKAGDITNAVKVYDALELIMGLNEEIVRRKHALYIGIGDQRKAARELERLVEAFPKNLEYRHLQAGYYEQIGNKEKAKEVYKAILLISPSDSKANLALAGADIKTSDEIAYIESLAPLFEQADIELDLKMGKVLPFITKIANTHNKNLAEAVLPLTEILERVHSGQAKTYAASGDVLYYSDRLLEALEKYRKTLQLDKSIFLVWEQMMRIHLQLRDYTALQQVSEEAIDLFPNKALAFYLNGVANRKLGHYDDAVEVLDQAFLMAGGESPLRLDILVQLGQSQSAIGQFEAANNAFDAALKIDPLSTQVQSLYSICLATQPNGLKKAGEMAEQALKAAPAQSLPAHAMGWVLAQRKMPKEAREWLDKAIANGGANDSYLMEHYGDLMYQMNDIAAARQYWTKSQELGNRSEALDKKLKSIIGR